MVFSPNDYTENGRSSSSRKDAASLSGTLSKM